MTTLTRTDWINAALDTLDQEGYIKVSSERVARRLNVTRGSFYHHFQNRDDFINAVLTTWETEYTTAMLNYAAQGKTAIEILERYIEIATTKQPTREVAIRAWALHDPLVAAFQQRVDQTRLAFATQTAKTLGVANQYADTIGKIAHLCLIGGQQSGMRHNPVQFNALVNNGLQLLQKIRNLSK